MRKSKKRPSQPRPVGAASPEFLDPAREWHPIKAKPEERQETLIAERLDDLEVYKRLVLLANELDWLSRRCASPASETALQVGSVVVRRLASALFRAMSIPEDED